jgi:N-acetyl-1-D-myo-inositol-2-amino-2-deoxy-alpha-D-glucopyranoside deacetylase
MTQRRLLLVHAHPDDESIATGGVMAKYAAEGAQVTLVTCTRGEQGEIVPDDLKHLGTGRLLADQRVDELADAMKVLGVTDHRFLGPYEDSGMIGTPENERATAFWNADLDEATAHLVKVIDEVRPHVVVTYDENGGYGHPDHIQAHRVAMAAVDAAADPRYRLDLGEPWAVSKVYWSAVPRSVVRRSLEAMAALGETSPFDGLGDIEEVPFVVSDEQITAAVDGRAHVGRKDTAMRAYPTQITVDGPFFALSNNLGQEVLGTEHYRLVRGRRGPAGPGPEGWEDDLFAGLDG